MSERAAIGILRRADERNKQLPRALLDALIAQSGLRGERYRLYDSGKESSDIRERCGCEGGGKGLLYGDDIAHTLNTGKDKFIYGFNAQASKTQHIGFKAEQSPALDTSKVPGVFQAFSNSCFGGCPSSETGQTLTAKGGGIGGGSNSLVNVSAVRRLTPLECERLMGLPDGYTDIPGASDSARYKSIGNGMAIPCSDYVLSVVRRMADV